MKILITGAGGQLGREWVSFLDPLGDKHDVTAFTSGELDITDRQKVRKVLDRSGPGLIINCAAFTDVDGAEKDPESAFLINERGVKNLNDWCEVNGSKLVHYSTDYIFPGTAADRERYPDGYTEEAATGPVNIYGESKLAGEMILRGSIAPCLLLRTSWLSGYHGSNFVKTMLRLGENRNELQIVDDQFGSPSFTPNVVENSWNLIRRGEEGVYHVACKGVVNRYRYAEAIFRYAGMSVELVPVNSGSFPSAARRPYFSGLSVRKLESVPGCRIIDWSEGIRRYLERESDL